MAPHAPGIRCTPHKFLPTFKAQQVEAELWMLCFGSPGEHQFDVHPIHVVGTPPVFEYHPFHYIDFKEQAYIWKQAAQRTAERIPTCGAEFFMDFGFMRSSTEDYRRPNKSTDRVVTSYDGYLAHLPIVDGASQRVWVFLTSSKDLPIDILRVFMTRFAYETGLVWTDQGGELAWYGAFWNMMLEEFSYVVEPTGADSPSQNDGAEIYNNTLAIKVRTLLYGSWLPAKFWSAALVHVVYLHNWLVHSALNKTPYEAWCGRKPNVTHLKMFGACVCIKQTGTCRCKLDCHNFTGIFLGYTATDQNILYSDLDSGIVKLCHHAIFDEAWYMQPTRPPAAQLLYDLGLESDLEFVLVDGTPHMVSIDPTYAPWPPPLPRSLRSNLKWKCPPHSLRAPLPLQFSTAPVSFGARAARVKSPAKSKKDIAPEVVTEYLIGVEDMAMVYISPDPFYGAFEEELDLCKFDLSRHSTAGLNFFKKDQRLFLALMAPATPGARIPRWRTQICGAWLIAINGTHITTLADAQSIFCCLSNANSHGCTLLHSHPEITPDISLSGLPIMSKSDFSQLTHDQLNNHVDLLKDGLRILWTRAYDIVESGNVCQYVTRVMRLIKGKLLKQDDWHDWQDSEFLQLDQYNAQGMFGDPVQANKEDAVFYLV